MKKLNSYAFRQKLRPFMRELQSQNSKPLTPTDYRKWWDENKEFCEKEGIPRNPEKEYYLSRGWVVKLTHKERKLSDFR